jgi:hypothetical protein
MRSRRILGRIGSTLSGAAAVALLMVTISGLEGGLQGAPAELVLLVFFGVAFLATKLPRKATVDQWTAVPAWQPALAHSPSSPSSVARALGRAEVRELALSPAFGAGLAFLIMIVVLFGFVWPEDTGGEIAEVAELMPVFVHPLVGMVVLAVHRARTRAARDEVEELFDSCPTSPVTRSTGHLVSAWMPVALTLAFGFAMVFLVRANVEASFGPFGARQVVAVLGAGVLAGGGVALGVALARWAPWTIAPVAALVAVGFVSIRLATAGGADQHEPLRQLSTFLGDSDVDYRFSAPNYLGHVGWLAALAVVVGVLAILRDRRTPPVLLGGVAAAVAAAGFAVVATRPMDGADADRIAAVLNDLPAHQDCVDAGGVDVCVFPEDRGLARLFRDEVTPVVAAVPPGTLDGYTMRSAGDVDPLHLDPAVVERLDQDRLPEPGLLAAEMIVHEEALQGARLWAALAAVGISDDLPVGSSLIVAGESRGVLALWLATRGARPSFVDDLTSYALSPDTESITSRPWPDPCYAGPTRVRWSASDVSAARRLVAVPEAAVVDLLDQRWAWAIDPDTTTVELLAALGLDPPDPNGIFTRSESC